MARDCVEIDTPPSVSSNPGLVSDRLFTDSGVGFGNGFRFSTVSVRLWRQLFTLGGWALTVVCDGVLDLLARPAGVARAVISGGLRNELPLKCFYNGPMFRHERPQKGRLRQFHQIGAELVGVAEPTGDVEIIALGVDILDALGVLSETTLELNTLGDGPSRAAYRDALVDYFTGHAYSLSDDSRERLTRNPLRILDSKDARDRAVIADAPVFEDYLSEDARAFFDAVRTGLDTLEIAYTLNPRLVRGLDYYSHTAFEFTTEALGACTAMTIRMYADFKKLPLDKVRVVLKHDKVHAEDCTDCETKTGKLDRIVRDLHFEGDLTDEQKQRLLEIADKCPVHKTIHSEIVEESHLV